jgi:hypothetical protein
MPSDVNPPADEWLSWLVVNGDCDEDVVKYTDAVAVAQALEKERDEAREWLVQARALLSRVECSWRAHFDEPMAYANVPVDWQDLRDAALKAADGGEGDSCRG